MRKTCINSKSGPANIEQEFKIVLGNPMRRGKLLHIKLKIPFIIFNSLHRTVFGWETFSATAHVTDIRARAASSTLVTYTAFPRFLLLLMLRP